eukprot:s3120_g16.t1
MVIFLAAPPCHRDPVLTDAADFGWIGRAGLFLGWEELSRDASTDMGAAPALVRVGSRPAPRGERSRRMPNSGGRPAGATLHLGL